MLSNDPSGSGQRLAARSQGISASRLWATHQARPRHGTLNENAITIGWQKREVDCAAAWAIAHIAIGYAQEKKGSWPAAPPVAAWFSPCPAADWRLCGAGNAAIPGDGRTGRATHSPSGELPIHLFHLAARKKQCDAIRGRANGRLPIIHLSRAPRSARIQVPRRGADISSAERHRIAPPRPARPRQPRHRGT
jgi:hypothetical protein